MIGFIGGTGPEGKGLALRFAMSGERVMIGSRDADRARNAAAEVSALWQGLTVSGGMNDEVASASDIVVIAVPYAGHRPTLESLRDELDGKLVVDVVAPPELQPRRRERDSRRGRLGDRAGAGYPP